jgi:hypothetical protein
MRDMIASETGTRLDFEPAKAYGSETGTHPKRGRD